MFALGRPASEGAEGVGQPRQHHFVGNPLDQQPATGRARLSGVLDDGVEDHGDGRVEVRIGEDDLRGLAPQLQRDRAMVESRRLRHFGAGYRTAGKGDVVDPWVGRKGSAGLVAQAGHDVQRARRKSRLHGELGDLQQGQARVFRRLEHAGVARGEGGTDAPPEDLRGIVPGDDVAGDPERHALGHDGVAAGVRDDLAGNLVAGSGVVLEIARGIGDVALRLGIRLADVARLDARKAFTLDGDQLRQAHQQAPALGRGDAAPRTVERRPRRVYRHVDVGGRPPGDLGEDLAAARIDDRQRPPLGRSHPLVADEVATEGLRGERQVASLVHGEGL
jgi:hypothetical protein